MGRYIRRARHFLFSGAAGLLVCAACLGILVPPSLIQKAWGQEDPPARAGDDDGTLPTAEQVREITVKAAALRRLAQDRLTALPRATFDPEALAKQLGNDIDAHFATVRDNTRWLPYAGALRSPTNVLMAGAGNTLDRARLLATLLDHAGADVRLARVTLNDADAQTLADHLREQTPATTNDNASPDNAPIEPTDAQIAEVAATAGVAVEDVQRAFDRQTLQTQELSEQIITRGIPEAERLIAILTQHHPADSANASDTKDAAEDFADHWWIQVRDGESWWDLDVAHPDGEPGPTFTEPSATFALEDLDETLPEELRHRVVFRVLGEQTNAEGRTEHVLLEETAEAWQKAAIDATLTMIPLDFPEDFEFFGDDRSMEETAAEWRRLMLEQSEWLPSLEIDGESFSNKSIRDTGEVVDTPARGTTGRKFNSAMNELGGMGAGATAESHFSAAWVEIETRGPGHEPDVQRRLIFDLSPREAESAGDAGYAAPDKALRLARAYGLTGLSRFLLQTSRWNAAFAEDAQMSRLLNNVALMPGMAADAMNNRFDAVVKRFGEADLRPADLWTVAFGRFGVNPHAGRVFVNRPNVLTAFVSMRLGPDDQSLVWSGIDIVHNGVDAVSDWADADSSVTGRDAAVYQGVFDTVMEAIVLESVNNPSGQTTTSASSKLATVATDDLELLTGAGDVSGIALDPQAAPAIRDALAQGSWVIVGPPGGASDTAGTMPGQAWWRIDPASGRTLGMVTSDLLGTRGPTAAEWIVIAIAVAAGVIAAAGTFAGCGGLNDGASETKVKGCLVCAFLAGMAAVFFVFLAVEAVAYQAGHIAVYSTFYNPTAQWGLWFVAVEFAITFGCNMVSWLISRAPPPETATRQLAACGPSDAGRGGPGQPTCRRVSRA